MNLLMDAVGVVKPFWGDGEGDVSSAGTMARATRMAVSDLFVGEMTLTGRPPGPFRACSYWVDVGRLIIIQLICTTIKCINNFSL